MQFEALSKILEMIESRLGRKATTLIILILYLAIVAVALHTIAEFLVLPTYNFLAAAIPTLGIQGATVTSILYVGAILAVMILLAPAVLFFWRVRSVPQRVLDHLAELRKEAVQEILNGTVSSSANLEAWKAKDDDWWGRVVTYLKQHFQKSAVLSFEYIGVFYPTAFPHAFDNEHNHRLTMLSTRLARMEDLIRLYSR